MPTKKYIMLQLISLFFLLLTSCTGIPKGIKPINNFEPKRYLGKWYEIARLDHSFEKGLDNVSAEYTLEDDSTIIVLNKGYNPKIKSWKTVQGKAYFTDTPNIGSLEVVFFWPFYGSYNIIDIDKKNYSYAMVCGYNRNYLWILSRTKFLNKKTISKLLKKAKSLGFKIEDLIFVEQNKE